MKLFHVESTSTPSLGVMVVIAFTSQPVAKFRVIRVEVPSTI